MFRLVKFIEVEGLSYVLNMGLDQANSGHFSNFGQFLMRRTMLGSQS